MDPISGGLALAGGVVSAFGAAEKADATSNMDIYKAGVARANAQIAENNAQAEEAAGRQREMDYGMEGAQKLGQIKVAQAGSGIRLDTGSAALTRKGQTYGVQEGEGIITADSARRAYGYRIQGFDFTSEAGLDTMAAQQAQAEKGWDMASSILGGASSAAAKWASFSRSGGFGALVGGSGFGGLFGAGTPT
jgi:hypothetical protein